MSHFKNTTPVAGHGLTVAMWNTSRRGSFLLGLLTEARTFDPQRFSSLDRQLRLFAAGCARRASPLLVDPRSRHAIQTAELFATGSASGAEINHAYSGASSAVREIAFESDRRSGKAAITDAVAPAEGEGVGVDRELALACAQLHAANAASHACAHSMGATGGLRAAVKCSEAARKALYWEMVSEGAAPDLVTEVLDEEDRRQAESLRTFIGNPFDLDALPPLTLDPAEAAEPRLRRAS